jgi:hypothetical protein
MKYLASILAAAFALALLSLPAAAAAQCSCANSSLIGTTVNTSAGFPGLNPASTVTSAVEFPTSALVLFPASSGASPRMSIDYGSNTIRVQFLHSQGYGSAFAFTFASLNPTPPAGCAGTPQIVGKTVQTNNASANFVVTGATSTAHSVTVPYAQAPNTNWQAGDFILITLQFGCSGIPPTGGFDPCCPPWNAAQLRSNLFYQGTGGIGAPYTLKFVPTAMLNAQMNTYVAYLLSLGMGFTSLTIQFELFNAGTGASAVPGGTPVTGSITWTGTGTPTAIFFPPGAMTAGPLGPWYRVRTTIVLNGGPGSSYLPASCLVSFVDVRLQVV